MRNNVSLSNNNLSNYFSWFFFSLVLIVEAFFSLKAYPFWHIDNFIWNLLISFILLLLVIFNRSLFVFNASLVRILVAFLVAYFYRLSGNINLYIYNLPFVTPICVIIFLKDSFKIELIKTFNNVLYVLIVLSTIAWLFHVMGLYMYSFIDYYGETISNYEYLFENYLFFVLNKGTINEDFRFCSIFLEPGYFSIILIFLLCVDHFDFSKNRNRFYLLAVILSFSLAGYLFFIIFYLLYSIFTNNARSIRRILFLSFILATLYCFFTYYNGGDNIVNEKIIQRLTWDAEKETIAGYNRTSSYIDDLFEKVISGSDCFFGLGSLSKDYSMSVGYKPYIIQYGIIGCSFFVLSLYSVYYSRKCHVSLILFLVFLLTFSRGHHVMFYQGFWLIYLCGIPKLYLDDKTLMSH